MGDLDDKLAIDEANRIARHEAVKSEVRGEVDSKIAREAEASDDQDQARVAAVKDRLKRKAVTELESTENEVERARWAARLSQVVDYIFYVIYALITLQIFLDLFGATRGNAFRNFIETVSSPLLAPFRNLFLDPSSGRFQLRLSYIFALIAYLLLHLGINQLLRVVAHRKTYV